MKTDLAKDSAKVCFCVTWLVMEDIITDLVLILLHLNFKCPDIQTG